jgi:hypothetical protein
MTSESAPAATRRPRSVHVVVHGVLLAVAVIAVPVLSAVGARTLLDSRDGEVIDPVVDPALPGYQALTSPSPTMAVVHVDPDGTLVGLAVLAMAGEDTDGGSVILVPPRTFVSVPDLGDFTIDYIQDLNGSDSSVSFIEFSLRLGIDETVELTHDDWAELVEPFGGLTVTNPDDIAGPDGALLFGAGRLELAPDEVGPYLAVLGADENPLNSVLRQELVWTSFLDAVAGEQGSVTFPGEQDRGLAKFVPAIAGGSHRVELVPLQPPSITNDQGELVFLVDEEATARLVPQLVPFPAGARPGDRPLARVLDGSGRQDVIPSAVRQVAVAGGQVVMIGNTDEFGVEATQVLVADASLRDFARSVVDTLGVGSVQEIDYIDESAEVIVVLGADYQP